MRVYVCVIMYACAHSLRVLTQSADFGRSILEFKTVCVDEQMHETCQEKVIFHLKIKGKIGNYVFFFFFFLTIFKHIFPSKWLMSALPHWASREFWGKKAHNEMPFNISFIFITVMWKQKCIYYVNFKVFILLHGSICCIASNLCWF